MIKIQKHSAVLSTDKDGYLIHDTSLNKIVPPWDEAVNFIKEAYIKHLGECLHSVYIRGSIARGLAVEGISDLDSFALLRGNPLKRKMNWIGQRRSASNTWNASRFLHVRKSGSIERNSSVKILKENGG